MKARNIVLITILLWSVATSCYGYYWVTSILARPDNYGYEEWIMFPLLGFIVYRFPFLLVGLILIIAGELMYSVLLLDENVKETDGPTIQR